MTMSNTMICGATKIWYYIPEHKSAHFEAWLEATRPGYIESLEAGAAHRMLYLEDLYYMCTWLSAFVIMAVSKGNTSGTSCLSCADARAVLSPIQQCCGTNTCYICRHI